MSISISIGISRNYNWLLANCVLGSDWSLHCWSLRLFRLNSIQMQFKKKFCRQINGIFPPANIGRNSSSGLCLVASPSPALNQPALDFCRWPAAASKAYNQMRPKKKFCRMKGISEETLSGSNLASPSPALNQPALNFWPWLDARQGLET